MSENKEEKLVTLESEFWDRLINLHNEYIPQLPAESLIGMCERVKFMMLKGADKVMSEKYANQEG